jgi:TorA maturation chaperone TorD
MTDHDPATDAARAEFCRFLAACFYEPAPEFAEEKLFDSMRIAAAHFDPELVEGARRLGDAFAAESIDDLRVEYMRLFLGPVDAPARPYGSLWMGTEKGLMRDSTMAVLQLYEAGGFDLAEDFRELPDHVAAELEFLYALLFNENRATSGAAAAEQVVLRQRLLREHLCTWIPPFAGALRASARVAFYRELADLTGRFIALEGSRLGHGNA